MSNDYGKDAPLSYNTYLRVPELIDLQTCLSSPAHHDELLFITVHQAYELWFKQILHEIDAAIGLMKEDAPGKQPRHCAAWLKLKSSSSRKFIFWKP